MSTAAKVLVVDDSALMRQMISRFLDEAGFVVVGTARNGRDGLEKALALKPDVITLDVEMPEMDGLEMLRRLMEQHPTPVVMLSSLTQKQAPAAVEALTLGAVDVVGKPGGQISLNLEDVRQELVRKVAVAANVQLQRRRPGRATPASAGTVKAKTGKNPSGAGMGRYGTASRPGSVAARKRRQRPLAIMPPQSPPTKAQPSRPRGMVVFGCSTGGPGALSQVIPRLPMSFPWAVLVIQHMPPGFTQSLARRLDASSALKVDEARQGVNPRAGQVWIAPGGQHLTLNADGSLQLNEDPPVHGVRPAVDPALATVSQVWGTAVMAVIMTGMGKDGARGAQAVRQAGGYVIAQDEATSVVYGMPRVVVEMGLAHEVLPLDQIAAAVDNRVAATAPPTKRRWPL